jgi:nitroreductase
MSSIKIANTQYNVLDHIKHRWSPRSFSAQVITENDMLTLLEAASWAPSANNSQPWRFVYALRGTEGFNTLLKTLAPANQLWAKEAAALLVTVGLREIPDSDQKHPFYLHDTGMANSFLVLQAHSMGISTHLMGGFSKPNVTEALKLDAHEEPVVVMALGYRDAPEKLEEPFLTRELTARTRKPLSEIAKKLN